VVADSGEWRELMRAQMRWKTRVPRGGAIPKQTNLGIPSHDATHDVRSGTNVTACDCQLRQVLIHTASLDRLGAWATGI